MIQMLSAATAEVRFTIPSRSPAATDTSPTSSSTTSAVADAGGQPADREYNATAAGHAWSCLQTALLQAQAITQVLVTATGSMCTTAPPEARQNTKLKVCLVAIVTPRYMRDHGAFRRLMIGGVQSGPGAGVLLHLWCSNGVAGAAGGNSTAGTGDHGATAPANVTTFPACVGVLAQHNWLWDFLCPSSRHLLRHVAGVMLDGKKQRGIAFRCVIRAISPSCGSVFQARSLRTCPSPCRLVGDSAAAAACATPPGKVLRLSKSLFNRCNNSHQKKKAAARQAFYTSLRNG